MLWARAEEKGAGGREGPGRRGGEQQSAEPPAITAGLAPLHKTNK